VIPVSLVPRRVVRPPAPTACAACILAAILSQAACATASLRDDLEGLRLQVEQLGRQQDRLRAAIRGTLPEDGAALFREGYALFHRGAHAEAEAVLRAFLKTAPPPALEGEARSWIGESLFARGRHREALREWRVAASLVGADERRARLLYRVALAQEVLGEAEASRHTLRDVVRLFPDSDAAAQARAGLEAM
jgi:TolA-binding protein